MAGNSNPRRFASPLGHRWQKRLNEQPLFTRKIDSIAPRSLLKSSHPVTARSGRHPNLEACPGRRLYLFSTDL